MTTPHSAEPSNTTNGHSRGTPLISAQLETSSHNAPSVEGSPANQDLPRSGRAELARRPAGEELHPLSSAQLLRPIRPAPRSGWRGIVYSASAGMINPGESSSDRARRELIARINQPLHGCYRIAALSLKGGVGKTVTAALLGATFASLRGDRVVALDANPDRGTLSQRVPLETSATVRHLLEDADRITRYSDVRAYTSQAPSRLEVLASEQDPAVSRAFSREDYWKAVDLLARHHNIIITDCGTGLLHDALQGTIAVADALLIVSSPAIDGARSAWATLDWLEAHGYSELVRRSVTVINGVRPRRGNVDVEQVCSQFARRCREVVRIPFDRHLDEGGVIDLDRLATRTRDALLDLAAVVSDDFARTSPHAGHRRRTIATLPPGPITDPTSPQ